MSVYVIWFCKSPTRCHAYEKNISHANLKQITLSNDDLIGSQIRF